jgi:hypothetical protein
MIFAKRKRKKRRGDEAGYDAGASSNKVIGKQR